MVFYNTEIPGLLVLEPKIWEDERGFFFEAFNQRVFDEIASGVRFVQDNQASSTYGVLRGLHYQVEPYAQAKLVRVLQGEVLDVVVDMREDSETYGHSYSLRLSAANKRQLFVPRGLAHGYVVLSDTAVFFYKVDNFYSKAHEGGICYNDPALKIDWQIPEEDIIVADRDRQFPVLGQHRT